MPAPVTLEKVPKAVEEDTPIVKRKTVKKIKKNTNTKKIANKEAAMT